MSLSVNQLLTEIFCEVLNVPRVDSNDSPETMPSWDSFAQIVLLHRIAEELDIKWDPDDLMKFYEYSDLCVLVEIKVNERA